MAAPEIIHSSEDPLFDDVRERGHNVIFILACFRHWQCFRVRRLCLRIFDWKIHKMARNIYVQIALDLTSLLIGKFWTFVYLNRILLLMLVNKLVNNRWLTLVTVRRILARSRTVTDIWQCQANKNALARLGYKKSSCAVNYEGPTSYLADGYSSIDLSSTLLISSVDDEDVHSRVTGWACSPTGLWFVPPTRPKH